MRMSRLTTLFSRLRGLLRGRAHDDFFDEELEGHLNLLTERFVQRGMTREEAQGAARRQLGNVALLKENRGDMRTILWLDQLCQDLGYAARTVRRSPGFTLIAVLILALGMGVNTAIFSAVDSVLLRPLPYADPESLVMVWEDSSFYGFPHNTPAPGNFSEWKARNHVFTDMAATRSRSANLTGDGAPEQLLGRAVTSNFFSVLGVRPAFGRTFTEEEDRTNAPVVVISQGLWQRRYLGNADVIGKPIVLNGYKTTVIGVLPSEFAFRSRDLDFWVPISMPPALLANRGSHFLNVVARIKPGVTIERARQDMQAAAAEMSRQYRENEHVGAEVVPVKEDFLGNTRTGLPVLMTAAGFILLIASANLASLLLARAAARQREISVRAALGADRWRLVRQLLTEGIALSVLGGALALSAAPVAIGLVAKLVPNTMPSTADPQLNGRLFLFSITLSLITGVVFSLIPAMHAARGSLNDALKQSGRSGISVAGSRLRDALVVVEVAAALVLLVGAGLMLQTLARLGAVDVGFRPDHLFTARTLPPVNKYPTSGARQAFGERILEGVRTLPGVESAAYVSTLPFLSLGNMRGFQVEGRPVDPVDPNAPTALYRVGTSDYLQTIGARLLEGRFFDRSDGPEAPLVVVVNQTLAHRFWPSESALGHRITVGAPTSGQRTIVGVVADMRERGYEMEALPGVYQPAVQTIADDLAPELLVRVKGDPASIASSVRNVVASVDPEQPLSAVGTMENAIEVTVTDRRKLLILLSAFASLGLLLASVGLYGVLSYAITQRSREIGLRIALGASRRGVVGMVVGRGMVLTGCGLAIGLGASWGATRLMKSLLYGIGATDTPTFIGVVAIFAVVGLAACWVPARRASRLDPIAVLREE
jgi:putative ABC transport system permease protein